MVFSVNDDGPVSKALTHIRLALNLAQSLQDGFLYQSHTSTFRCESTLLHILTPVQSTLFLQWLEKKRAKVHESVQKMVSEIMQNNAPSVTGDTDITSQNAGTDISVMNELCEKLKGSLMIPTAMVSSKET